MKTSPALMFELAGIIAAGRPAAWFDVATCRSCDESQKKMRCRSLRDFFALGERPAPHVILSWRLPDIVLCDDCLESHRPTYDAAKRRVLAIEPTEEATAPLTVSLQMTAQRLVFLRQMERLTVIRVVPATLVAQMGACLWCRLAQSDAVFLITRRGITTAELASLGPTDGCLIHDECLQEANDVVHTAQMERCMASCALWLPLLPEMCRLVGEFVCQLALIDIGEAAAERCPVYRR